MRGRLASLGWPGVLGLGLLIVSVAWSVTVGVRLDQGFSLASPYLVAPIALAVGVVAGTFLAAYAGDSRLHLALAFACVGLVLGVLLTREPGKEPLGYANANAALAVQLVAMCGLAMLSTSRGRRRSLMATLALAVVAVGLNRSAAGLAVVAPLVVVIALVHWRRPQHRGWALVLGVLVAGSGAAVILRLAQGTEFPSWARGIFDTVREQLWHDAAALWLKRPWSGSGPGSFQNATALSVDPDTAMAHSSVLQIGAETGWIGVALFGLIAFAGMLVAARGRAPQAVIAIAALTALLVHSYADHLLEFAPVVISAGLVLGWAAASRLSTQQFSEQHRSELHGSEELDVSEGERPVGR